jgi:hypothetical protein
VSDVVGYSMREIDLIIGSYCITVVFCNMFLVLAARYDILLITGILSIIPLILTLNQRRKEIDH